MREMMMDDGTSKKDILTVFSNNPNNEMDATLMTDPDYLAFGVLVGKDKRYVVRDRYLLWWLDAV